MIIDGRCHCGNLFYELETELEYTAIEARACDCSFCRRHAAKNWSDPRGRATIRVADAQQLQRYVFALATSEFFICKVCGVYLGAVLFSDDGCWSTVNLRLSDLDDVPESSVSYGEENESGRIARRKQFWTPTQVFGMD